jgi:uncharacterized protein with PIN domain
MTRHSEKTTVANVLVSRTFIPRYKRCPRCNQRLFVIDGEIESHMEIPSAYGAAPQQCLPNNKAP